jgi:hypothetical protein
MSISSQVSVAHYLRSNKSAQRTPLGSLKVKYSNIHLSQITVDTDHVAKAAPRKTLLDNDDEYFVPETQGNPTLDQFNMPKEKAVSAVAYPKGVERLTTISYPQPKEDWYKSSDDDEDIIDELELEDICQFEFWLANITQVSHQKKLHNQTVVGMIQHCCISALQNLIMEGEQHAPDQFNHMNCLYERHLDAIGARREIQMRLSEHNKKGSKWSGKKKIESSTTIQERFCEQDCSQLALWF